MIAEVRMADGTFWLVLVLIIVLAMLPRYTTTALRNRLTPSPVIQVPWLRFDLLETTTYRRGNCNSGATNRLIRNQKPNCLSFPSNSSRTTRLCA